MIAAVVVVVRVNVVLLVLDRHLGCVSYYHSNLLFGTVPVQSGSVLTLMSTR